VSAITPYVETSLYQIALFIKQEDHLCGRAVQDALAHARSCGKWLWLAYDRLKGTGRWLAWLAEATGLSQPTAWRYMKLEQESRQGGRLFTLNNVPMSEALQLLAAPQGDADPYDWAQDTAMSAQGAGNGPPVPPPLCPGCGFPLPCEANCFAADEPPPAADADRLRDPAGLVIPDRLLAVFALSAVWDEAELRLRQAAALLEKLEGGPGGDVLRNMELLAAVDALLADFPRCRPFASTCAYCQPASAFPPSPHCFPCAGRGWLTRPQWEVAPAAARARLLNPPTEDA
jgi:hypothetical protein